MPPNIRKRAMRSVITIAAIALAASVIVPRYLQSHGHAAAPDLMTARQETPATNGASNSRSVVISPGRNGHFQVEGRIDGRRLDFMVDTGASLIALTERDAAMLGIHPAASEYTAMVRTANGNVRAAPVELNMVEIDDIVVRNVAAMVMPDGALSDNLLGLTFLSRLHRFEYSEGKLVLEQ
jgi:aspartyl protease family protein